MKTIIREYKVEDTLDIEKALICYSLDSSIIAYRVSGNGKGMAILVNDDGKFGFNYHKYACRNHVDLKFVASEPRISILSAIHSGRNVVIFDTFEEFVTYAEKIQ